MKGEGDLFFVVERGGELYFFFCGGKYLVVVGGKFGDCGGELEKNFCMFLYCD